MAKDKKDKKKKKKLKAAADTTIYIVLKHGLKNGRINLALWKWVAVDGKAHRRGSEVVWQVMEAGEHKLEIDPPEVINRETLRIVGKRATADIYAGANPGYYEYIMTVDGEPVEGGSAPGIIIE